MHPLTLTSCLATLAICWIPGGFIHYGARQSQLHAHHDTEPPVAVLVETLRTTTAAMVR